MNTIRVSFWSMISVSQVISRSESMVNAVIPSLSASRKILSTNDFTSVLLRSALNTSSAEDWENDALHSFSGFRRRLSNINLWSVSSSQTMMLSFNVFSP